MSVLGSPQIRARRRPGVIVLVWGIRLVAALLVALPIESVFRGLGIGRSPFEDAGLFEPGAMLLTEAVRLGRSTLVPMLQTSFVTVLVLNVVALFPLALLYVALGYEGRLEASSWVGESAAHVPRFLLLAGVSLLSQAITLVAAALMQGAVKSIYAGHLSQKWLDLSSAGVLALGLSAALVIGIVHDLARAASVRGEPSARDAIARAIVVARRHPLHVLAGWSAMAALGVALVAAAAFVSERLHVERTSGAALAAIGGLHQLTALALVALRASWIARTLRLIG